MLQKSQKLFWGVFYNNKSVIKHLNLNFEIVLEKYYS
jgi:hypothetical protein